MPRTRATRRSVAHGRETVVSLTQTEIMLVLAAVILLLLLAKNVDLAASESDLASAKRQVAALAGEGEDAVETLLAQREQADLAQEVKEVLTRDAKRKGGAPSTRLAPEDVATIEKAVATQAQQEADRAAVDRALERAGAEPEASRQRQLEQLEEAAALAAAVRAGLSEDRQRALDKALAGPRPDAEVRALLSAWLGADEAATGSGDQVGFNPCWPGPAGPGQRRYYFAYDITYANGEYLLRPHRDWRSSAPVVADALAGPLGALRDHPREPVSAAALRTFGQRVDADVERLRRNGTYPADCLLAVTLNEEASGAVAKFLRGDVRFYPVTR